MHRAKFRRVQPRLILTPIKGEGEGGGVAIIDEKKNKHKTYSNKFSSFHARQDLQANGVRKA